MTVTGEVGLGRFLHENGGLTSPTIYNNLLQVRVAVRSLRPVGCSSRRVHCLIDPIVIISCGFYTLWKGVSRRPKRVIILPDGNPEAV